jgi:hypothetical protein
MLKGLQIAILLTAFLSACAVFTTPSKNDWLANAPEYSQSADADAASSELSNVGGNGHNGDHMSGHSHSGHR